MKRLKKGRDVKCVYDIIYFRKKKNNTPKLIMCQKLSQPAKHVKHKSSILKKGQWLQGGEGI